MPKTPRKTTSRRRKTYRQQAAAPRKGSVEMAGGTIEEVNQAVTTNPLEEGAVHILDPTSNYVVVTYFWGRNNLNRNIQFPCPEDINEIAEEELLNSLMESNVQDIPPVPRNAVLKIRVLKLINDNRRPLTDNEKLNYAAYQGILKRWNEEAKRVPSFVNALALKRTQVQERELAKPGARQPTTFGEMMAKWDRDCIAANVNYASLNIEVDRSDYQNAINAKPLFIKRMLDVCAPRSVVYIDGDMLFHKQSEIFELKNIDFMCRGWNVDSRNKPPKSHFDPYILETSGGIMYFGNTQRARKLLDEWHTASSLPRNKGKADDRILSQVFTTSSRLVGTNTVQLPSEYLWLTMGYDANPLVAPLKAGMVVEHPFCLTGEERAGSQGASSNRTPDGYTDEIEDMVDYKRPPELIYEYIYFDENQAMREEWAPYLTYLKNTNGTFSGTPLAKIVDFADKYGEFNEIANRNIAAAAAAAVPPPQAAAPPAAVVGGAVGVQLPAGAPIPAILAALMAGQDVEVGGEVSHKTDEDEMAGTDGSTGTDGINEYYRSAVVDTTKPMFFSARSVVLRHLLAMCASIEDINQHTRKSYMFMSRIRWNLEKPDQTSAGPQSAFADVPSVEEFSPIVHQIWFGGAMPEWRRFMFDKNKAVCEAHGYTYRLWGNADRTAENFPSTFGYQEEAIRIGQDSEQNRFAQVADLARLEIVYLQGGIYIDSLFEISPIFLKAIAKAVDGGALFVGCNEDPCEPPIACRGFEGREYLTNSFFAAIKGSPVLERLLDDEVLGRIDLTSEYINRTTGPYFLRSGIQDVETDRVFLFKSNQIYQFSQQPSEYQPARPNPFLSQERRPGTIKVNDRMFYKPGGIHVLQERFLIENGPIAIYHSGLGGTWST